MCSDPVSTNNCNGDLKWHGEQNFIAGRSFIVFRVPTRLQRVQVLRHVPPSNTPSLLINTSSACARIFVCLLICLGLRVCFITFAICTHTNSFYAYPPFARVHKLICYRVITLKGGMSVLCELWVSTAHKWRYNMHRNQGRETQSKEELYSIFVRSSDQAAFSTKKIASLAKKWCFYQI